MKKLTLFAAVLLLISFSKAQTLKIAHKSHGGKARSFKPSALDHFGDTDFDLNYIMLTRVTIPLIPTLPPEPLYPTPEFNAPAPIRPEAPADQPCDELPSTTPIQSFLPKPAATQPASKNATKPAGREAESADEIEKQPVPETPCPEDGGTSSVSPASQESRNSLAWLYAILGFIVVPALVLGSGAIKKTPESKG